MSDTQEQARGGFKLVAQVGRVPSMVVPLDREQELRFERLMDTLVMLDMHQHPLVLTENMDQLNDYFRARDYAWGYEGARAGGWTAVTTANILSTHGFAAEGSYAEFSDLVTEVALMLADMSKQGDGVVKVQRADDVLAAKQRGVIGFLPTVEHLAMGNQLHYIDVLYGLGIRLAGLTYSRKTYVGDGPKAIEGLLEYCDEWMPRPSGFEPALPERMAEVNRRATELGRGPIPATIFGAVLDSRELEQYEKLGAVCAMFRLSPQNFDTVPATLERAMKVVREYRGS